MTTNFSSLKQAVIINNNNIKDHFIYRTSIKCVNNYDDIDISSFLMAELEKIKMNYALYVKYDTFETIIHIYTSKHFNIDKLFFKIKFNTEMGQPIIDPFPFCLRLG